MNKGFTLTELLAVIVIISLLTILALPNILDSVRNSKDDVENVTFDIIKQAANLYVQDNESIYEKVNGNVYCIAFEKLVNADYLKSPITDFEDDTDLTFIKTVKVSYYDGFSYEIVDNDKCIPKINE